MNDKQQTDNVKEYQRFALKRGLLAGALIIALLWGLAVGVGYLEKPQTLLERIGLSSIFNSAEDTDAEKTSDLETSPAPAQSPGAQPAAPQKAPVQTGEDQHEPAASDSAEHTQSAEAIGHQAEAQAQLPSANKVHEPAASASSEQAPAPAAKEEHAPSAGSGHPADALQASEQGSAQEHIELPTGVAFVNAVIEPIEYELKKRFWGWRPNDIVNITDNVNNFQLGVLEVTRRSAVQLAERISRTGSTDSFNPHLENAMNWVMVKATRYWFPSPESKYKESLDELAQYRESLMEGKASFHTRTDNLIPLLAAYEDLLGSCDENLVKYQEEDGGEVSFFAADDYFYYAKGVASAMATILEAVHHDFAQTIEVRHAEELLHHALESCRRAAALAPWIITDGDLDGILANHRAHMAAPISHARFYMGQLVKTLST